MANGLWSKIRRIESVDRNVLKYVFESDDAVAESVLYKYPTYEDRTVICCSTQSGCPIGCRFCGAGDAFVRSLSADEIVSQPLYLFDDQNINPASVRRLQIMFMSMGEPLLNFKALDKAIRILFQQYPQAALLISTSAPRVDYDLVNTLSCAVPTVGLQFSVHESTDDARNKLIPFHNKLSLAEIAVVGDHWYQKTGRRPFFNYCAHEANSSLNDAKRIANIFDPHIWEATVSVICERDESIAMANERQKNLALTFQGYLLNCGFSTRMFNPAGQDDIGGGCGQLWFVQDWMRSHPSNARPSVGRGLPSKHAPMSE